MKPSAKRKLGFDSSIKKHFKDFLGKRFICIDPATGASSDVGWALFDQGQLQDMGVIKVPKSKPLNVRLKLIYQALTELPEVDVCLIEQITKARKTHLSLLYSIGVFYLYNAKEVVLIPPTCWHALVPDDYVKTDMDDAFWFGVTAIKKSLDVAVKEGYLSSKEAEDWLINLKEQGT